MRWKLHKFNFILNRILSFPDNEALKITTYLKNINNNTSKLILSKIEFKNNNFDESLSLLLLIPNNENYLINCLRNQSDYYLHHTNTKKFHLHNYLLSDLY